MGNRAPNQHNRTKPDISLFKDGMTPKILPLTRQSCFFDGTENEHNDCIT